MFNNDREAFCAAGRVLPFFQACASIIVSFPARLDLNYSDNGVVAKVQKLLGNCLLQGGSAD